MKSVRAIRRLLSAIRWLSDGSVSSGIISATGRTLDFSDGTTLHNLIQTDAAVNPGNSGGGLFDSHGALVGIVCAKSSSTEVEGLGLCNPCFNGSHRSAGFGWIMAM